MDLPIVLPESLDRAMYEISIRLPNRTLEVLSLTPHWASIASAAQDQNWWHRRVEHLVGKSLQLRKGNWAGVYRDFEKNGATFDTLHNYYNQLIVPVLYEIGAVTSNSYQIETVINRVVEANNVDALKLLLSDRKINHANLYYPITSATVTGSVDCLRILLEDGLIDPASVENSAIRRAVEEYQMEAFVILLADKRVDPSDAENYALKMAATHGYADMFELLLADKRVRNMEENHLEQSYFIADAVHCQHKEIVEITIHNTDADIGYALIEACKGSNLEIINLLLSHQRRIELYYLDRMPSMIDIARRQGRDDVAELLLSNPKIVEIYEADQLKRLG